MSNIYAKVIVDISNVQVDKPFDYLVPDQLKDAIVEGSKVIVPFGRRNIEGYVIELCNESSYQNSDELKTIVDVVYDSHAIPQDLITMSKWLSDKYLAPFNDCLNTCIPSSVKGSKLKKTIRVKCDAVVPEGPKKEIFDLIAQKTNSDLKSVESIYAGKDRSKRREFSKMLMEMAKERFIEIGESLKDSNAKAVFVKGVKIKPASTLLKDAELIEKRRPSQAKVLRCLASISNLSDDQNITLAKLSKLAKTSFSVIKSLIRDGMLEGIEISITRDPYNDHVFEATLGPELTPMQSQCVREITGSLDMNKNEVYLLRGVTGSGKTEVYLRTLEHAIKLGKKGILLVPDIALTPQMVKRVKSRFGKRVAIMHSALSHGERHDEWLKAKMSQVDVVVGVRSAVFAPLSDIGIIIVDEEHDTSYKQSESPHYSAREVAIKRAELSNAVVVLGSATPSVETYYKARCKDFKELVIDKRIDDKKMPQVKLIDMRNEFKRGNRSLFSNELTYALSERLIKGEQVILFMNRRGYSTFVLCRDCGKAVTCQNCDVSLVYHAKGESMTCHYCDHVEKVPDKCNECGSSKIKYFGAGTERIEEEVKKYFPDSRVLRMDFDTTRNKGDHARILDQFAEGKADILVGTQMIAKGLDIPNVTLVGVVAADTTLNLPDFRAPERTFQLISQVAGRAGRGNVPGEVIVQSYNPDHFSLRYASQHDYVGFYDEEIQKRIVNGYPPLMSIIRVLVASQDDDMAKDVIFNIYKELNNDALSKNMKVSFDDVVNDLKNIQYSDIYLMPPSKAPIPKISGKHRWHMIIRLRENESITRNVKEMLFNARRHSCDSINIIINYDPQSIL